MSAISLEADDASSHGRSSPKFLLSGTRDVHNKGNPSAMIQRINITSQRRRSLEESPLASRSRSSTGSSFGSAINPLPFTIDLRKLPSSATSTDGDSSLRRHHSHEKCLSAEERCAAFAYLNASYQAKHHSSQHTRSSSDSADVAIANARLKATQKTASDFTNRMRRWVKGVDEPENRVDILKAADVSAAVPNAPEAITASTEIYRKPSTSKKSTEISFIAGSQGPEDLTDNLDHWMLCSHAINEKCRFTNLDELASLVADGPADFTKDLSRYINGSIKSANTPKFFKGKNVPVSANAAINISNPSAEHNSNEDVLSKSTTTSCDHVASGRSVNGDAAGLNEDVNNRDAKNATSMQQQVALQPTVEDVSDDSAGRHPITITVECPSNERFPDQLSVIDEISEELTNLQVNVNWDSNSPFRPDCSSQTPLRTALETLHPQIHETPSQYSTPTPGRELKYQHRIDVPHATRLSLIDNSAASRLEPKRQSPPTAPCARKETPVVNLHNSRLPSAGSHSHPANPFSPENQSQQAVPNFSLQPLEIEQDVVDAHDLQPDLRCQYSTVPLSGQDRSVLQHPVFEPNDVELEGRRQSSFAVPRIRQKQNSETKSLDHNIPHDTSEAYFSNMESNTNNSINMPTTYDHIDSNNTSGTVVYSPLRVLSEVSIMSTSEQMREVLERVRVETERHESEQAILLRSKDEEIARLKDLLNQSNNALDATRTELTAVREDYRLHDEERCKNMDILLKSMKDAQGRWEADQEQQAIAKKEMIVVKAELSELKRRNNELEISATATKAHLIEARNNYDTSLTAAARENNRLKADLKATQDRLCSAQTLVEKLTVDLSAVKKPATTSDEQLRSRLRAQEKHWKNRFQDLLKEAEARITAVMAENQAKEKTWKEEKAGLLDVREKMGRLLLRQWGKEEFGDAGKGLPQRYRYRYAEGRKGDTTAIE